MNVWSSNGELPLDLALRAHNSNIAATLVQNNADVNIRDAKGETLLHRAIKHQDAFSALFLLDNNCDATLTTRFFDFKQTIFSVLMFFVLQK